jgi:hypothetical protein
MQPMQTSSKKLLEITNDWCSSHVGFVVGWTTGFVLAIILALVS